MSRRRGREGGDCDLASCESGDAVIRVRDNVPWKDRIRITGNETSQKTQFSKSLYTRFDGTREHHGSSCFLTTPLIITKAIKDTEGGGNAVEAILLLLAKQQKRDDGGTSS